MLTIVALAVVLLTLVVVASMTIGARVIPARSLLAAASGHDIGADGVILWQARLPRTLAGLAAGAALGVSGALIQAISRNPLGEPGILGINAGAGLAVAITVAAFGHVALPLSFAAGFAGALLTALLVFAVGAPAGGASDPRQFVLAGMALGAVAAGLSSTLSLLDPATFDRMRFWAAGSLDVRDLRFAIALVPVTVAGCAAAMLLARALDVLALGRAVAVSLGARPVLVQSAGLCLVAVLCGASTALTGPIGFVGLMVPYAARRLAGTATMARMLPLCMILGPALLLAADVLGRVIVAGELRVSIVTAFLGAPLLIAMARNER